MRVGFIGDVIGRPGREILISNVKEVKKTYKLDFVVANCENASGGFGINSKNAIEILKSGVDVITGGNHSFDQKDIVGLMDEMPILRPYNHYDGISGKGIINLKKDNKNLCVINLMGNYGLNITNNAFFSAKEAIAKSESKNILIDFHAEVTSEKRAMMCYLNGEVSAIFGTHTHIGTDDLQIYNGTAYVTDVGLSGNYFDIIGFEASSPIKSFLTGLKHSFSVDKNAKRAFQMVVFETDNNGKAVDAFKIRLIDGIDEILIQRAIFAK
ncbi:YmdB family metallophosphoesterase [Campylobacter sp. RM12327]|uniref:TIGR00282 family metallophosphoesterase n=1 Tax=Campylobacter sputorum TaxID=206 RepID=UPI000B778100|nr:MULTISPECIES: TIGR00282 family metallophosphoesterase [Campylobacter]ASM39957.1 metallophosphatase [Campylobacter sputorum]MBE7357608.1 YmdB family metallophosphoesterase [Campylobacter sp. RM11302]MBF6669254.1 YmdB family metallophosphoesterase [Campylobacter sp. RM12327]MBF6674523.1 YmdB family metallophosphoesterase [Campylobacter sp. RM13538]MBF6675476.1 YmdB family metallophosphoesterase [Campylobacter sp. RM12321]